jgi:hypothetical protein
LRTLFNIAVFLVCGLGLGYCTADYSMQEGLATVSVRNGPWIVWPLAGSTDADPYTRAHFAANGHLPLTAFEALTFRANTDDHGQPLDQACEYVIEGRAFKSRWWSLTAYQSDRSFIQNEARRYSFNSRNIIYAGQGEFEVVLASDARPGNWLPLRKSGRFQLTLRLYNPQSELRDSLQELILPKVKKVGCA